VLSALIYLRATSFANWARTRAQRLRQPKYLIGAIVGFAYFYFFFIRSFQGSSRGGRDAARQALAATPNFTPADWLPLSTSLGAMLFFAILVLRWVVPTQRAALGFSEAEISFLFPAPVTRRALLHFRLISTQLRSLLGAGMMMLFTNRWSFLGGNAFTHAVGWWFIFSALGLHFSGAGFTLTRMADAGVGVWRRRVGVLALVAAIVTVTFLRLPDALRWPAVSDELGLQPLGDWSIRLAGTAPFSWALWPFQVVLGPFLAIDVAHFLVALVPALLVLTLHYLWVARAAVAFEEASVEHAERRSARIAAWRAGERARGPGAARSSPFVLHSTGRPEIGFLWKNLLSTWEYFTPRVFLVAAALIALAAWWGGSHPIGRSFLPGVGAVTLVFSLYVLVVGPQFARQDIRADLHRADVLKAYPLAGWQIVLGEILAPTVILTGILWLALLTLALTFHPTRTGLLWLTPGLRATIAVSVAAILPAMVFLQMLVPNAAALVFPGWFHATRMRGGGPEVVGQRMIFFFAQTLTMALAAIPALFVGAIPFLTASLLDFTGPLALMICTVSGATLMLAILLGEIAAGIWFLGTRFEKLDLSAELAS
jgi:hypothetical protein